MNYISYKAMITHTDKKKKGKKKIPEEYLVFV